MSFQATRDRILGKNRAGNNSNASRMQIHGFGGVTNSSLTVGKNNSSRSSSATAEDVEENFAGKYSHLTSSCKSDLFLIQMRRDKLSRVLAKFNTTVNATGTKSTAAFTNTVTLGESEIQKLLQGNKSVDAIVARRKFKDVNDAVISLSMLSDLETMVNDKLWELHNLCSNGLRSTRASGVAKFNIAKPSGSKRRQVKLHLSLMLLF